MQNQKLSVLLQKLEAAKETGPEQDQLVNINDELAQNLRAVYGANNNPPSNGTCNSNDNCSNNTSCSGNGECSNNGTCDSQAPE